MQVVSAAIFAEALEMDVVERLDHRATDDHGDMRRWKLSVLPTITRCASLNPMFFGVSSQTYHSPITIRVRSYARVLTGCGHAMIASGRGRRCC